MKNLPKEKRDKIVLVLLATATILAGLYYGLISNQRKALTETAKKKVDQENRLASAERLVSSVSQVEKNLEQATATLRAIEGTMASGDMYSWVIQTVNGFKENYDIEIPQFSREVAAEVGMFSKFPYKAAVFHLRGSARYRDFGRFVADFENAFPYMRIQNIELDPAVASSATGNAGDGNKEKLAFKFEIVALVKP
jgi:Tfp pilus assembly protein PilO